MTYLARRPVYHMALWIIDWKLYKTSCYVVLASFNAMVCDKYDVNFYLSGSLGKSHVYLSTAILRDLTFSCLLNFAFQFVKIWCQEFQN